MSWAFQPLLPGGEELSPDISQDSFRFYADGSESGSTPLEAKDTNHDADISGGDVDLGLRIRLQETSGANASPTDDYQLQYELNDSGTWYDTGDGPSGSVSVVDSYSETNQDTTLRTDANENNEGGQSFTGDGKTLETLEVYMSKDGADPPTSYVATVYAHSGTYGTSSVPTGVALATSDTLLSSAVSTSLSLIEFTFSGSNKIELVNATNYVWVVTPTGGGANAEVIFGTDNSSPSHSGNACINSTSWTALPTYDICFYVNGAAPAPIVTNFASSNLTNDGATTNRLGSGGIVVIDDNFNDNSIDGAKWDNGGSGQVVETNNQIEITTQTGANYFQLIAVDPQPLINSSMAVEVKDAGNQALTTRQTILYAELDTNNKVYLQIDQGNLSANYVVAGTPTYGAASVTYNSTTHRWLRLRELGGTTYWEYSADGDSWTTLYSLANPIALTAVYAGLQAGNYAGEASGSTSIFDNFSLKIGNFSAGLVSEDGLAENLELESSNFTELLYSITLVAAELADTDTLDFRVLKNGAVLDAYNVTPRITADAGAGTQTLTLPLISNSNTLYAPTLVPQAITITMPLITNSPTLYAPTLTPQAVTLTLPLITNSPTLYAPTLEVQAITITLPLISNTNTLYSPTLSLNIALPLLTNTSSLYAPTLNPFTYLELPLLTNTNTLYAPTLTAGAITVDLPLITNSNVLYAPTLSPGQITIDVPLLTNTAIMYPPSLTYVVELPIIDSTAELYPPTLYAIYDINVPLLTNTNTLYAPTVTPQSINIELPLIDSSNVIYPPTVTAGGNTIVMPLIDSTSVLYEPSVTPQSVELSVPLINSTATLYAPILTPQAITVSMPLLASTATLHPPTLSTGAIAISLPLIDSQTALYAPTISPGSVTLNMPFIDSGAVLYAPTVEGINSELSLPLLESLAQLFPPSVNYAEQTIQVPLLENTNQLFAFIINRQNIKTNKPIILSNDSKNIALNYGKSANTISQSARPTIVSLSNEKITTILN